MSKGVKSIPLNDDEIHFAEEFSIIDEPTAVWRILIVDDDQSVHEITTLALNGQYFLERELQFLHAYSGSEAFTILQTEPDIAVVLLDVVMETPHAGLDLARQIRQQLNLLALRIVLRTGQAGQAPVTQVTQDYEINEYLNKSEITRARLLTVITTAIRSYQQICTINNSRQKLEQIVGASMALFERQSMEYFAVEQSALLQLLDSAVQILQLDWIGVWFLDKNAYHCKSQSGAELITPFSISSLNAPHYFNFIQTLKEAQICANTLQHPAAFEMQALFGCAMPQSTLDIPLLIQQIPIGMVSFAQLTHPNPWALECIKHCSHIAYLIERLLNNSERERTHAEQLQNNEKMAVLGRLVASVAHEINTPIGAIKSSGQNINDSLRQITEQLPLTLEALDEEGQALFKQLIRQVSAARDVLSSREERAIVRQTAEYLELDQISDAYSKASLLVQLNAWQSYAVYLPLLRHPQCDLILDTAYSMATIASNSSNINMAVERVAKIIFALKSFSRIDASGQMTQVDLRDGIETVLTIYHSQIKPPIELVRDYADIAPLLCLPDELNQVWTNLIHNALQAMQGNGTLTISLRRVANEAVVSVEDTGCGIPEAIRERIFDVFFTTKPIGEGSGLGLDIVKKIINKHHGRIEVRSTVGVGSIFVIYLPYGLPRE